MKNKINDYVIEAVHYSSNGRLEYVRLYERRGSSYSDRELFDRNQLIKTLKSNKRVVTGQRVSGLGSTFKLGNQVELAGLKDDPVIICGNHGTNSDDLDGVPIL
jgi:hypothetical protein